MVIRKGSHRIVFRRREADKASLKGRLLPTLLISHISYKITILMANFVGKCSFRKLIRSKILAIRPLKISSSRLRRAKGKCKYRWKDRKAVTNQRSVIILESKLVRLLLCMWAKSRLRSWPIIALFLRIPSFLRYLGYFINWLSCPKMLRIIPSFSFWIENRLSAIS